ncbi:hypothetical protein JYU34_014703 [Plutella xylostella]|uniref:Uncharacterized protein n=1 Tax=Plutella xylostella TaxID=51655 RepID=A0ABQ7Q9D6_PLUXY|nr:hypothetical protein JYU34_014703 [Plutella xylostella]
MKQRSLSSNMLIYKGLLLIIALSSVTLVSAYCPVDRIEKLGYCVFRVHCRGTVNNITLPAHCQGSPNHPVRVDLTITEAIDRFDDNLVNTDFLDAITTLRISGTWPTTTVEIPLLQYTSNVENLYLIGNNFEQISANSFSELGRLENLDLSHNRLTTVEGLFQFDSNPMLKRLSLAYNSISDLPSDTFDELTSLVELDLSHNNIQDLTQEPFSNLTNLEILRLNNNTIRDLNGAVNNLTSLKHLFVRGNQLQNIDAESLQVIYHLETFDVSCNDLDTLKPAIFWRHWMHFEGQSTCKILLSDNRITSLPNATFKEMTDRFTRDAYDEHNIEVSTELYLSNNEISNIEYNAFQTIVQLSYLDLSRNKLKDFIVNPDDLANVRFLNLSSNVITHIYFQSFSALNNLYNLDLSRNQLDDIPERSFINNFNLKNVNLTHNNFKDVTNLRIRIFHPSGGMLDLSNNGLSKLRIQYGEALRLTMLVLDSNNITDLALVYLREQNDLKSLILTNNQISHLHKNSLYLPIALMFLDLSFNQISVIGPSSFSRVSHLQTLRLSHNNITAISYGTFNGLKELRNLDLSFNKITFLDSKVLMEMKLLQFLSIRHNEMDYLNDKSWLGHKLDLQVCVDGNNFTCGWLSTALANFDNGFSKMRPVAFEKALLGTTLEGISCIEDEEVSQPLVDLNSYSDIDERLLVTSQKILEAIREQTVYLKKMVWHSVQTMPKSRLKET